MHWEWGFGRRGIYCHHSFGGWCSAWLLLYFWMGRFFLVLAMGGIGRSSIPMGLEKRIFGQRSGRRGGLEGVLGGVLACSGVKSWPGVYIDIAILVLLPTSCVHLRGRGCGRVFGAWWLSGMSHAGEWPFSETRDNEVHIQQSQQSSV